MKTVNIMDELEYLQDAALNSLWEPKCPYCHHECGFEIEFDYFGELNCDSCGHDFKVEGM